ncbi:MAG: permease prefix domain 1-containing protein, partial [Planctomycetota bacterium]
MVEIDRALMQWRSQWKAQVPAINVEVLDEMERHLRDSILARLEDDSDNDAAIKSAIEEFGGPEALIDEFKKVPSERLPWWPVNLVWT